MRMGYFAVIRDAGPGWRDGTGAFEQPDAGEHASFMNKLAEEGFLLFAGPLAGSETDRVRVFLMTSADTEAEVHDELADDPWSRSLQLVTTTIESWIPIVGLERLARA
jgi:hypothetical protein